MNVMEVAVHIVSERHGTPRIRDDNSCGTSGEQMHGKPNRLGCDEDVGQGVLKSISLFSEIVGGGYLLRSSRPSISLR